MPASASGSHVINAYGSVTPKASVPTLSFTATPGISISRASGAAGTSVTVSGSGFGAGETGIAVTYDGTPAAQGITANLQGGWSAVFVVPDSVSGYHTIGAYGSLTQAATVAEASFNIGSAVSISPDYGYVGETVSVTGSGFAVNAPLKLFYDDQDVPAGGSTTDSSGSFSESITVPKSVHGRHTISDSDIRNNNSNSLSPWKIRRPPYPGCYPLETAPGLVSRVESSRLLSGLALLIQRGYIHP